MQRRHTHEPLFCYFIAAIKQTHTRMRISICAKNSTCDQTKGEGLLQRGVVKRFSNKMSMIQVISHSGGAGGIAADRTPFYGIKLPSEVKKLLQLSKTVEHATMRKILKCTS